MTTSFKNTSKCASNNIIVVASESGGHILPALTLAQQEHAQGRSITFISGTHPLDYQLVTNKPYLKNIVRLTLAKRTSKLKLAIIMFQLFWNFVKSIKLLHALKPQKVITTGGLISLPICYAAALLGIAREVHELNAVPGMAVKALLPTLKQFYSPFVHHHPKWKQSRYPLRLDIVAKPTYPLIHNKKICLFIQGGSQGSVLLNNLVLQSVERYENENDLFIVHQTGIHDLERVKTWYQSNNIPAHVFTFETNINRYYAAADLIISRAGAGSLFEIIAWKKRAIIVPLATNTTSHQVDNAQAMTKMYPDLITVFSQEEVAQEINFTLFFGQSDTKVSCRG